MGFSIEVKAIKDAFVEWIEDVELEKLRAKPGEDITVSIKVRKVDGPVRRIPLRLKIPEKMDPGSMLIHVGSSVAAGFVERKISPPLKLTTYKNYLGFLNAIRNPRYIYVQMIFHYQAVLVLNYLGFGLSN